MPVDFAVIDICQWISAIFCGGSETLPIRLISSLQVPNPWSSDVLWMGVDAENSGFSFDSDHMLLIFFS